MSPIAAKEFRDALRNHWLQGYAGLLAVLGLVTAWAAASGTAGLGLQMFGRTAASLTSLCLLLAPLVSLALGAATIAGERDRGALERLLSQPIERRDLLLGKFSGLLRSLLIATACGYLPAGIVLAATAGPATIGAYLLFPAIAMLVIAALLGIGLLVSVHSKSGAQAQARAIFLWFVFVMLYDLVLMGTLMTTQMGPAVLAALLLLNPVSAGRLLVVLTLEADLYLLGPAGAWLVESIGQLGTTALLLASLLTWALGSLAIAIRSFRVHPPRRRERPGRAVDLAARGWLPELRRRLGRPSLERTRAL